MHCNIEEFVNPDYHIRGPVPRCVSVKTAGSPLCHYLYVLDSSLVIHVFIEASYSVFEIAYTLL